MTVPIVVTTCCCHSTIERQINQYCRRDTRDCFHGWTVHTCGALSCIDLSDVFQSGPRGWSTVSSYRFCDVNGNGSDLAINLAACI
jgi:hypothetical protein